MRTMVTNWALWSVLCMMGATGATRAADPNLVGYWKLDGDTLDASGNNRHGTLGGNPQFVPGVEGEALEFDGDDSLTITGYKGIEGTNPFSIAAWIKTKSTDTKTIVTWGSAVSGAKIELRIINNVLRANHGADTLILYVRGASGNKAAPFYVALEDASKRTATVTHPDPALVTTAKWTMWKIPLSQFTGVNVAKIKKLCLGVGDRKTPAAGGAGRIYIDDIRMTKP
jgi:hypothetical protein